MTPRASSSMYIYKPCTPPSCEALPLPEPISRLRAASRPSPPSPPSPSPSPLTPTFIYLHLHLPRHLLPHPPNTLVNQTGNKERVEMGKRHNRKRTRSRPRNRNNNNNNNNNNNLNNQHVNSLNINTTSPIPLHTRSESVSTASSTLSPTSSCFQPLGCPLANVPANHWHQTYTAWQTRLRLQREQEQELETQRLRIFGGLPEDERCLMEPMLKVVTDLFDGFYDYEDP
ncbi:hypothetical protein ACJQWK_06690 [Exserohilum turcicum]